MICSKCGKEMHWTEPQDGFFMWFYCEHCDIFANNGAVKLDHTGNVLTKIGAIKAAIARRANVYRINGNPAFAAVLEGALEIIEKEGE